MSSFAVYTDKFDQAVENVLGKFDGDLFVGLTPDNTIADYVWTLYEAVYTEMLGKEVMSMSLGDLMKMPRNEAVDVLTKIFCQDTKQYIHTYRPV